MALTIIPGYDFAVDETPTKVLLERQATDLDITGVPTSQFAGTITAIVVGDSSGVSGGQPTDVGWIWADPGGNRVLGISEAGDANPRVDSRMWHAAGGWETSRYLLKPKAAGGSIVAGKHLWQNGTALRIEDVELDMDVDAFPYGLTQEFQGSPATNGRVVGRGLCVAAVGAQVTELNLRTRRPGILTDNVNQATWRVLDQIETRSSFPNFAGTVMGRSEGSTGTSFAGVSAAVWFININSGQA